MNGTPFVRHVIYCLTDGVIFMPKGVPNKRYTPDFKKPVAETMQKEKPSRREAARQVEINNRKCVAAWEFEQKTIAFAWDKTVHNPGRYTLSQTEFVLAFKKGKFPTPRGARNIKQLLFYYLHSLLIHPAETGLTYSDWKWISVRRDQQEKWRCFAGRSRTGIVRSIRGLGSFAPTSTGRFPVTEISLFVKFV